MGPLQNRKGQVIVESILMTAVLFAVFMAGMNYLKTSGLASKMVTGPWKKIAGMAEYGNWEDPGPAAQAKHPNTNDRAYTKK